MDARVLQSPFSKSFLLHLLLLLMFISISIFAPKIQTTEEPITVKLIDVKKNKVPNVFDGEKDQIVKENHSARKTGGFTPSRIIPPPMPNSSQMVQVKDLGVKIATDQSAPIETRKNWAAEALGEDLAGGEYVEGLKENETSALNTKENVFFSYTNRIRGQLYQVWSPIIRREVERFYSMGFSFSDNTMFITRTKVILNAKGEITKVQLLQESGVVDLDEAAITALNKAGPYPNPPRGLIDEKGEAELQWNFILRN